MNIPADFEPGYDIEEACPCGCSTYQPSMLNIAESLPPMNVELCTACQRVRLEVSKWHKMKGTV